jgi:hypothetical protein
MGGVRKPGSDHWTQRVTYSHALWLEDPSFRE